MTLLTIIKKELRRVFSDRRIVFSAFILPGLSIFILYSIMGTLLGQQNEKVKEHISLVTIINADDNFKQYCSDQAADAKLDIQFQTQLDDDTKSKLGNGDIDLIVVMPDQFSQTIQDYQAEALPDIHIFSNPAEDYSTNALRRVETDLFGGYKNTILTERFGSLENLEVLSFNKTNTDPYITKNDNHGAFGSFVSQFLPPILMMILFAGAMGIGIDTIAGEKERGTMANLLLAPINRNTIALGKLISLGIVAIISSGFSLLAIILSLPRLMSGAAGQNISTQISYQAGDYAMIMLSLLLQVGIYVGIICLISVIANSVKEAGTYLSPAYMVVMIMAFSAMYSFGETPLYYFAIPILGNIHVLKAIFSLDINPAEFAIATASSVIFIGLLVTLIAKAFNSEKIMVK